MQVPPRTEFAARAIRFLSPSDIEQIKLSGELTVDLALDPVPPYRCIDCKHQTNILEEALEHQDNQARHHNWYQRFRRWRQTREIRWQSPIYRKKN